MSKRMVTCVLLALALTAISVSAAFASTAALQKATAGGNMAALGAAAGKAAGKPVALPKNVKVGFVEAVGASEGEARGVAATQAAAKLLGWSVQVCDGQGVPSKIATCFQSMINQNVNVILSGANDAAIVNRQLREAKAKKILVFNTSGDVPESPLFTGSYAPNDTKMAKLLDGFLFAKMNAKHATTLAVQSNAAIGALRVRRAQLARDLKAHPQIKVVAENQTDLADANGSVTNATRTVVTANPNVSAFWASIDFDLPPIARTVHSLGKSPIIVGWYGDKENLALIKQGLVTGVVESSIEASNFIALDRAAELLARHVKPSRNHFGVGIYKVDFLKPFMVTKANLPPAGSYPKPPLDYTAFFNAKWKTEFTR